MKKVRFSMTDHQAVENLPSPDIRSPSYVVGVGASAGGLRSIEQMFHNVPPDCGMCFVVVQHLSPDFRSLMGEILSRQTQLRVQLCEEGLPLESNCIFLIPPGKTLTVEDGAFQLKTVDRRLIQRPIDVLFRSLADCYGRNLVGIVLSGTGSDGSEGLVAIHEVGGLTIAESTETAQFDGMPMNAVRTGAVDIVLKPEEIGPRLLKHMANPGAAGQIDVSENEESPEALESIFAAVEERRGIDFGDYKNTTVLRRIERRVRHTNSESLEAYASVLRENESEQDALCDDLLIGVTKFFRDSDAFFRLFSYLNQVVSHLEPTEELRVWVAGCATGEEPYTLAMLIVEAFDRVGREPRFKILATDLHQGAMDYASQGVYPRSSLDSVSDQRQQRFFIPVEESRVRVDASLRRHIVFARHNVIIDPPFSRVHLVSCRNLLIYLRSEAQALALRSFHYALKADGVLMLGPSETLGDLAGEFETLDGKWRIYRKTRDIVLPLSQRVLARTQPAAGTPARLPDSLAYALGRERTDRNERLSFTRVLEAYSLLLEGMVKSGILIDEHRQIIHVFGNASRYLEGSPGRYSGNLMKQIGGKPRTAIGSALVRAAKEIGVRIVVRNLQFFEDSDSDPVDVAVRAYRQRAGGECIWLLEFTEGAADGDDATSEHEPKGVEVRLAEPDDDYSTLEAELTYTRESLSATIEELETSNEELQSTNEEVIASNEELQSTNEELHSVNEELYSVNSENQRKIVELHELSEDIEDLLRSTEIGTIFVDDSLKIRRFTPAATQYFHLVEHDIGRSLENFTHNLQIDGLTDHLTDVIANEEPQSLRIVQADGGKIILRMVPYQRREGVRGAILHIIDPKSMQVDFES